MEVLEIQPIFMQSTHAQDSTAICTHCDTSFPHASTGANICLKCLTTQTDITNGITKQAVLNYCYTCHRFFGPPWTHVEPESKELLALCLRRIRGLNKAKIIDASFVWTEPQSHRVKVKLTIQKELMKNVNVQRTFTVEYVVHNQQCEECKKEYISDNAWGALVQVRQKVDQRKSMLFLEQLILKYNAHNSAMKMKGLNEGVDFFYKEKAEALRLVDFLQSMFCVRVKQSKQLVSQEEENANNYKYVYSVELPKASKDDLVILTPRLAEAMGGCSCVLVCSRVGTSVQLTDPTTMGTVELNGVQYFQYEDEMTFVSAKDNLVEFIVFEIENCDEAPTNVHNGARLAKVQLVRKRDLKEFEVKTYLSNTVKEGNCVVGYDLTMLDCRGYFNNIVTANTLPEVLIVKKSYMETINRKRRTWRLKHLDKEQNGTDEELQAKDYEDFLNELEADPEMRLHINLYRNEKAIKQRANQMDDENGSETSRKTRKKQIKRKLKVKRRSKGSPQAATGGQERDDRENNDDDDDDMQEERRSNESNDKEKEEEEEDPMVKIEELLADLTLEDDEVEEEEGDAIEEFIRRLEMVRIEGKE